ncbi:hypothetical protein EJP77_18230 [Paenibacillus zeisoli]|uniref:Uncharacterized protein n=1 Tax=Paenibacillus zeisoli TaxID=2496267 RepID=A0A433X2B5_9BACL|nr:hypothetical protein EJP77_18230 [Paenibacillus zeisoli]
MGEEKPDEELMGKRKSSPRLSTTFGDVDIFIVSALVTFIPAFHKKRENLGNAFFISGRSMVRYRHKKSDTDVTKDRVTQIARNFRNCQGQAA